MLFISSVGKLQLRPRYAFVFLVTRISRCHVVLHPVFPACETILRHFYRVYRSPSTRFIRCEFGNCARALLTTSLDDLFLAYSPLLSCPNPPEKRVQEPYKLPASRKRIKRTSFLWTFTRCRLAERLTATLSGRGSLLK